MNKQKIAIWGLEFSLDIIYDCYPGEDVLDTQKEAIEFFLAASDTIEESRRDVEKYILANNSDEVGVAVDNIFKYVMPKTLYIPRVKGCRSVAIMCDYKFDPEHGIAAVFENEVLKTIGLQDIIL